MITNECMRNYDNMETRRSGERENERNDRHVVCYDDNYSFFVRRERQARYAVRCVQRFRPFSTLRTVPAPAAFFIIPGRRGRKKGFGVYDSVMVRELRLRSGAEIEMKV